MLEVHAVRLHQDGRPDQTAEMTVHEDVDQDVIRVTVATPSRVYEGQDTGHFEALCAVRRALEQDNLLLCVQGAARTVYPSPMALAMGARVAYRLTFGQPARTADLVDIFEPVSEPGSTLGDQARWYALWLQSLRTTS